MGLITCENRNDERHFLPRHIVISLEGITSPEDCITHPNIANTDHCLQPPAIISVVNGFKRLVSYGTTT